MNLEEFDNKLSEAFKNEHLPPNDKLWQNISGRLDERKKRPFWYWLMPVVILFIAAGAWIAGNGVFKNDAATTVADKSALSNDNTQENNTLNAIANTTTSTTTSTTADTNIQNEELPKFSAVASSYSEVESTNTINNKLNNNTNSKPLKNKNLNNVNIANNTNTKKQKTITKGINNTVNNSQSTSEETIVMATDLKINSYKLININAFEYPILVDKIESTKIVRNTAKPTTKTSKDRTADFDSKWWWSAGLGPQLATNNMRIDDEFKPFCHKHLWDNKKAVTGNGTGFQSQFLVGYKLNKYFSIESGLQYSLRSEYIRLNEESHDIAFRRANGSIETYRKVILFAVITGPGGSDTTRYNAVQAFTLITNNKYHAFTIPLKINTEFKISESTKLQFGLGMGFTYMYANKNKHFDMVKEQKFEESKKGMFMASFNSQLALYTNFNNLGEIGVYTGFQGYANRWQVVNKQYSIGMNDFQLGVCFRRPF